MDDLQRRNNSKIDDLLEVGAETAEQTGALPAAGQARAEWDNARRIVLIFPYNFKSHGSLQLLTLSRFE